MTHNNKLLCLNPVRSMTCFFMLLMLMLAWPAPSLAQTGQEEPSLKQVLEEDDPAGEEKEQPAVKKKPLIIPQDELERDTPYSSAMGFLNTTRNRDYVRAAEYLDLRHLSDTLKSMDGEELARQLKIVLDRTLWIDFSLLSKDTKGHVDDGLPSNRDYVGSIELDGRKVDILLQRVPRSDGPAIWMFSNASVRHIPQLYERYGFGPIGEQHPES